VIAPILRIVPAAVLAAVALVRNATAVARLATLRVHALRHPEAVVVREAMVVVVVVVVEGTAPLVVAVVVVVAVKKLGSCSLYLVASPLAANAPFRLFKSYTCGGVGHLSRDCGQGSKCYNCSAIVGVVLCSFLQSRECASLIWSIYPRVTSAAIVRSPKGALAIPADQRGSYYFVWLLNSRSSNDVSAGQAHLT
jgi:hypothetical protein